MELRERFEVREIKYDPYQLVAVVQRLQCLGLPMMEFPQSVPNLTEASTNIYALIKGRTLEVYPDADIRISISRAVAIEGLKAGESQKRSSHTKSRWWLRSLRPRWQPLSAASTLIPFSYNTFECKPQRDE